MPQIGFREIRCRVIIESGLAAAKLFDVARESNKERRTLAPRGASNGGQSRFEV